MNLYAPVSSIMTTHLYTVSPEESLWYVKELFEKHNIHHIPVVHSLKIVGIVSKTDFLLFMGGMSHHSSDRFLNEHRLKDTKSETIMVKGLGKLEPDDRIEIAVEIFSKNLFHALPVVKDDELVGIITTYDIIKALVKDKPARPEDAYETVNQG